MGEGTAILFDFNGVLVNDEPLHRDATIATLAEYGIDLDAEGYARDFLGFDDRACFRFAFTTHRRPADAEAIEDAVERKHAWYARAARRALPLVPGAERFVRQAKAEGRRVAIVSGALRREVELALEVTGLGPLFECVLAAEDVPRGKPDPAGYLRAREALGVPPGRCVVIEDSLPGLAAARAAGLRCAMLTTSHPAERLAEADLVWESFEGRAPADLPWTSHD